MSNTSSRTSTGSTNGVTTIQMKSSSNGKGASIDVLKVTEKELSVEEALEAARQQAEDAQKYIVKLEAEKKKRDQEEQARKAREATEIQERQQFEAFKAFMSKVSVPKVDEVVQVEQPQKVTEPVVPAPVAPAPIRQERSGLFGEDTNRLIATMGGTTVVLVLLYLLMLGLFGKANDSMKLMFDSFPLRMYINVLIEVVAIGVGFLGLRLLFPEQYKYVHSKLNSLCSPKLDWEASSPEFRLRFASEQLWRFAFLFVLALMVIFT